MYVDNDPLVLAHARALLTSTPEGVCDYIDGDLRDPEAILAEAARTLDFGQPVALMLLGVLHHIPDTSEAQEIVRRLVAALAPGSYEATNHSTSAVSGAAMEEAVAHWNRGRLAVDDLAHPAADRPVFDGRDLLPPRVVSRSRSRPASSADLVRQAPARAVLADRPATRSWTRCYYAGSGRRTRSES